MMVSLISALLALAILCLVTAVALLGWGGRVTTVQRFALCAIAAGLAWAGPARMLGGKPALGDLLFLAGLLLYLAATYAPPLWRHVDGLDGQVDGRVAMRPKIRRPL